MDYPFHTKKIGQIEPELLAALQAAIAEMPYNPHPAFGGQTVLTNQQRTIPDTLIQDVLKHLPQFPTANYNGYELNRLNAGQAIAEHSDVGSRAPGVAYAIAHRHKIHLVVDTNPDVLTWHRRSKDGEEYMQHMAAGGLYLYNDYIWHRVANRGQTDRVHMLLSFWDRSWDIKEQLIDELRGGDRYELPAAHNIRRTYKAPE